MVNTHMNKLAFLVLVLCIDLCSVALSKGETQMKEEGGKKKSSADFIFILCTEAQQSSLQSEAGQLNWW